MNKLMQHKTVDVATTPSDVLEQRATWILLCTGVLFALWISGTSLLISSGVFLIAALPAFAQILTARLGGDASHELEMAVWIVVVMIGATAMGGATSPISIAFFIPVVTALSIGRKRQAIEASAFAVLGFCLAALLARMDFLPIPKELLDPAPGIFALVSLIYMASLVRKISLAHNSNGMLVRIREQANDHIARLSRQKEILSDRVNKADERANQAALSLSQEKEASFELKEKLAQRTLFFAKTSHELRSSLNAILGFSEVMKEGVFGELSDKYKEYAQMIHEGGKSLQMTVDDILDLSKIDAGQYKISPVQVSLTELMWDMVKFMSDQARRSDIKLSVSSLDRDVEAFADPRAVRHIAQNLVSNAIKFTPHGGAVAISVREDEDGGSWMSVRDTGPGMDPAEFEKILKPFIQTDESSTSGKHGTGLGLSVVNGFAQLHGGHIQLDSQAGEGSIISVYFPKKPTPSEAEEADSEH